MKKDELIARAHELVRGHFYGALATQGDYPFASLVRYSVDEQGQPLLILSRIAEHTKNLANSCKVSLLVMANDKAQENIQECARITLLGTLEKPCSETKDYAEALAAYYGFFPESRAYLEQLDFDLYRLRVESCRYVGGFAAAHHLSGEDYCQLNPLSFAEREGIMVHMNDDHVDAMEHYCRQFSRPLDGEQPVLVALDRFGFNLRLGKRIERFVFPFEVSDRVSAREAFVAMAKS